MMSVTRLRDLRCQGIPLHLSRTLAWVMVQGPWTKLTQNMRGPFMPWNVSNSFWYEMPRHLPLWLQEGAKLISASWFLQVRDSLIGHGSASRMTALVLSVMRRICPSGICLIICSSDLVILSLWRVLSVILEQLWGNLACSIVHITSFPTVWGAASMPLWSKRGNNMITERQGLG